MITRKLHFLKKVQEVPIKTKAQILDEISCNAWSLYTIHKKVKNGRYFKNFGYKQRLPQQVNEEVNEVGKFKNIDKYVKTKLDEIREEEKKHVFVSD